MGTTLSIHRLVGASALLLVRAAAGGQWLQIGSDLDGENPQDYAGGTQGALALSADGSTVALGAPGHDGAGDAAGHVRVFDLVAGAWAARGQDLRGEHAGDRSGASVVLSAEGTVVGIGAPGSDSDAGSADKFDKDFGQVRVFEWTDGAWSQRGEAIAGAAKYDYASDHGGLAMDAAGGTVVVGAADHTGGAGVRAGHVRVFDWDGAAGLWMQRGADLDGHAPGDWFGMAVAVNAAGTAVAVGAPFGDLDAEAGSSGCVVCRGSVRVYDWDGSAEEWVQRGRDLDGELDHDYSGSAVALNDAGDLVAIGSPRSSASFDAAAGAVTVYAWDGSAWQRRGVRIEGGEVGDRGGHALALSAVGTTVAVGARLGDGGSEVAGRVRVHDWDGAAWVRRGDDIDGEHKFDYSGYSLALSADGARVASGARFTDDAGKFAGHARVFGWSDAPAADAPAADACGDDRFEESPDVKRHRRRIAKFSKLQVATTEACNGKCADTSDCRGTQWNASSKTPCTILKGGRRRRCAKNSVCCSLVGG